MEQKIKTSVHFRCTPDHQNDRAQWKQAWFRMITWHDDHTWMHSVLCNHSTAEMGKLDSTLFVGIFRHPGDGDASDFRVAEPQQEGAVWFGQEHVLRLLLVHKPQDGPGPQKRHRMQWDMRQVTNIQAKSLQIFIFPLGRKSDSIFYPSFQCGFRCFFMSSTTPSNHCQNVKLRPGKFSCTNQTLVRLNPHVFMMKNEQGDRLCPHFHSHSEFRLPHWGSQHQPQNIPALEEIYMEERTKVAAIE